MCRELDLDFEHDDVHFASPALKQDPYLTINPNGRVPAIVDGDLRLWESMAINLYLARKHGGPLCPQGLEQEAHTWQWSFWVMTEIEKPLLAVLLRRMEFPEGSVEQKYFAAHFPADPEQEAKELETLARPFGVLEAHLADRDYLLADRFTVADLNVASVLAWARLARIDLAGYPRLDAWLTRCLSRPAFQN